MEFERSAARQTYLGSPSQGRRGERVLVARRGELYRFSAPDVPLTRMIRAGRRQPLAQAATRRALPRPLVLDSRLLVRICGFYARRCSCTDRVHHSPKVVTFDNPTHEDVATFRNPSRLRFDTATFRDSADETEGTPSDDAFNAILEYAIQRDSQFDFDEDEGDELLPPSSLGRNGSASAGPSSQKNGKAKPASQQKKKGRKSAAQPSSSSDTEGEGRGDVQEESEEEDFMREGGEDDGCAYLHSGIARAC